MSEARSYGGLLGPSFSGSFGRRSGGGQEPLDAPRRRPTSSLARLLRVRGLSWRRLGCPISTASLRRCARGKSLARLSLLLFLLLLLSTVSTLSGLQGAGKATLDSDRASPRAADIPPRVTLQDVVYGNLNASSPTETPDTEPSLQPAGAGEIPSAFNSTEKVNVSAPNAEVEKPMMANSNATQPPNVSDPISRFARNYSPNYPQNTRRFFAEVRRIMRQKWSYNETNAQEFRRALRAAVGEAGEARNMYLTRRNTSPQQKLPFCLRGKPWALTDSFWATLPNNSLFHEQKYDTCSIVGSSGLLNQSNCGGAIDLAEFVVRFNLAPVKDFEADVGSKTNFTTINPSFIVKNMESLKKPNNTKQMEEVMRQFRDGHIFLPTFAVSGYRKMLERTGQIATGSGLMKPLHGNPEHFSTVSRLWKAQLGKRYPTTGLYVVTSLLDTCKRLTVYGFWPFPTLATGKGSVVYHYHDKVEAKRSAHNFSSEFKILLYLHELGIIKLHLQSCGASGAQ